MALMFCVGIIDGSNDNGLSLVYWAIALIYFFAVWRPATRHKNGWPSFGWFWMGTILFSVLLYAAMGPVLVIILPVDVAEGGIILALSLLFGAGAYTAIKSWWLPKVMTPNEGRGRITEVFE